METLEIKHLAVYAEYLSKVNGSLNIFYKWYLSFAISVGEKRTRGFRKVTSYFRVIIIKFAT